MSAERAEIIYTEYQEKGPIHRDILPFHPARTRYNLALSLLPRNLKERLCIDFGGGDGAMSTLMADMGAQVIVVDSDPLALQLARKGDPRLSVAQSKSNLPFKSEIADAVVMLETLEHIRNSEEMPALNEANRVLKTDGTFIISVPSDNLAITRFHYRHYGLEELRSKLKIAGFSIDSEIFYRDPLERFAGKKPFGRYIRGISYGFNWLINNQVNFVRCGQEDAHGYVVSARKSI